MDFELNETQDAYVAMARQFAAKALEPKATMAGRTKKIINSFVNDIFDRLATQAAALARVNKKQTLGSREMQTAVRLVLPADLAKHAMSEGTKAVGKM